MPPLTAPSAQHPTQLYTLMEESPPPVPPKDTRFPPTTMEVERPISAHASASKRKRNALDITTYNEHGEDENTPKRRRSPLPQSDIDADASDEAGAAYQKNVRRKKGSRNLSNLNLRHAAETQKAKSATVKSRKSKFLEGSLTDKPSEKPPSVFMRFIRMDSGNIKQVATAQEDLMEDYHNSMEETRDSVDRVIAQEKASIPSRVAQIEADKENKSGGGTFGKWASGFHPVALWNKVFAQTREEIIREDFEEAERRAREKADFEARYGNTADLEAQYAEMKKAGMFKPKHISNHFGSVTSRTTTILAPRDSGIVIDDELNVRESQEDQRATSQMSGLLPTPQDDTTSASEAPETASKPAKTLKSRLHLKKPSLTNISGNLKRAKSDFNLTQTLHHRESSPSISPVKTDFENSALKKSHSKYDLKKQHKLSKRVSDLESKLSMARKELDEALVEASPMPKLGSKYERFTPQSTLKRPKFVPGKLPSLPSERILMAQQQKEIEMKVNEDEDVDDAEPSNGVDLEEFLAEAQVMRNTQDGDDGDDEETIKARGPHNRRQYPTRASSLFSLSNNNIEQQAIEAKESVEISRPTSIIEKHNETSDLTEPTSSQINEMDPNSITDFTTNGVVEQNANPPDYADLDAKLNALDANVKAAAKAKKPASKTKKRKSGTDQMDKEYKPGKGTEDDSEYEQEKTPKKKRKSTGEANGSPNKGQASKSSPNGKKVKKTSPSKKTAKKSAVVETTQGIEEHSADEGANQDEAEVAAEVNGDMEVPSARLSFESQTRPLEPVFEEAEEDEAAAGDTTTTSISVPLNDEPSKPTAKATPARHSALSINGRRSRSASPNKRPIAGAEEQMITRAAEAARSNPARTRGRSDSPPPGTGPTGVYHKRNGYATAGAEDEEAVRIVPGEQGVPAMPNGNGKIRGRKEGGKGEFEWPDDVF